MTAGPLRAVAGFLATAAVVAAALVLVSAGTDARVPAEAMVLILGSLAVGRLLLLVRRVAPPAEPGRIPLVRIHRETSAPDHIPGPVRELQGLVAAGLVSGRAAHLRLRPRLADLADTALDRHGLDRRALGAEAEPFLFPAGPVRVEGGSPGVPPEVLDRVLRRIEELERP